MARLAGKIVLVTGGASGIGEAIVRASHKEGARVLIADIHPPVGRKLADELGERAHFLPLDVAEEASWITGLDAVIADYGRLDVLVNNAGVTGNAADGQNDPEHTTLDEWRRVMRVNLDGVFLGCKHGVRVMRPTGGSIINMSSRSGLVGVPHQAAYAASKAAVRNHTKSVALYCAEQGLNIRCNSVHPAAILTPMWEAMLKDGAGADAEAVAKASPLHRFGRPDEVAAVVILLASDEATFITGSEFNIDGGILAGSAGSPK